MTPEKVRPFVATVREAGNSKRVTIGKEVAELYGIKAGDKVSLLIEEIWPDGKANKEAAADSKTSGLLSLVSAVGNLPLFPETLRPTSS